MKTNLYLVRHGEAVCNVTNMYGGSKGCQGLTERGHAQVARLADRLAGGEIAVDVLYASTFRRARETAEAAAGALKLPIQWDDEIQEIRPGDADGLTYEEVRERFQPDRSDLVTGWCVPGGENWAIFVARATAALDRIVQRHPGQTIMVVAHGGIVAASFYLYLGLDPATVLRTDFDTHHTSLTQWGTNKWERDDRMYLIRYNDSNHLADFDPLPS